jgi:hypothetical protein
MPVLIFNNKIDVAHVANVNYLFQKSFSVSSFFGVIQGCPAFNKCEMMISYDGIAL